MSIMCVLELFNLGCVCQKTFITKPALPLQHPARRSVHPGQPVLRDGDSPGAAPGGRERRVPRGSSGSHGSHSSPITRTHQGVLGRRTRQTADLPRPLRVPGAGETVQEERPRLHDGVDRGLHRQPRGQSQRTNRGTAAGQGELRVAALQDPAAASGREVDARGGDPAGEFRQHDYSLLRHPWLHVSRGRVVAHGHRQHAQRTLHALRRGNV